MQGRARRDLRRRHSTGQGGWVSTTADHDVPYRAPVALRIGLRPSDTLGPQAYPLVLALDLATRARRLASGSLGHAGWLIVWLPFLTLAKFELPKA